MARIAILSDEDVARVMKNAEGKRNARKDSQGEKADGAAQAATCLTRFMQDNLDTVLLRLRELTAELG